MDKEEKRKKKEEEKPKYSIPQCVGYLFAKAWQHQRRVLVYLLIASALVIASSIVGFYMSPTILGSIERGDTFGRLLGTVLFFVIATALLDALTTYVGVWGGGIKQCPMITLRSYILRDLQRKLGTTSYPHVLDPKVQKLYERASNCCNGNNAAAEGTWGTLQTLISQAAMFVFFLLMLTNIHPAVLIVTIAASCINFVFNSWLNKYNYRHRDELSRLDRRLWYTKGLAKDLSIAKDIRLYGLRSWINRITDRVYGARMAYAAKEHRFYLWGMLVSAILEILRGGLAYLILLKMCVDQDLSAATFLLYFSAIGSFNGQFSGILNTVLDLRNKCLDLSSLLEYINIDEPFKFEAGAPVPEDFTYEITLEHVSYTYPNSEKKIIDNISLTIKRGEKVAIVGLNGAGKTTLVKLICGLIDPDEGRILLGGRDIREFDREKYYALFSAVFQTFNLLDITVAETVAQTAEHIDMERVRECVELAGLTKTVSELPNGLETHLGRSVYLDGVMLSGGQTQRLMLARALYKNGAILMLDEPTAALDPLAESDMYHRYNDMTQGKTSVFISHRLASTRFCDRVLYLADGRIAEEGTHDQLIERGGEYAHLFEVQSRYYREGRDFDGEEN